MTLSLNTIGISFMASLIRSATSCVRLSRVATDTTRRRLFPAECPPQAMPSLRPGTIGREQYSECWAKWQRTVSVQWRLLCPESRETRLTQARTTRSTSHQRTNGVAADAEYLSRRKAVEEHSFARRALHLYNSTLNGSKQGLCSAAGVASRTMGYTREPLHGPSSSLSQPS